jgi:biopolymer transport protein ExbD
MKLSSAPPPKKARIEIIPLIDIMFFLLASFMLVSLSMVKLQNIKTNLPNASTGKNVAKPDFVAIGIDKAGLFYFDKETKPIDPDKIPDRLKPILASKSADFKVFVNADSGARYANIITALEKLREAGVTKVSFPVVNKPGSRQAAVPAS